MLKLSLTQFSGVPAQWTPFWDSFSSTIDQHEGLADVDKLKYLMSSLSGEAANSIAGLSITNQNYEEAVEILQHRYGDRQFAISQHLDTLVDLPKIDSADDLRKLRTLFNKTEAVVRTLTGIGESMESYRTLLTPIIMKKIPTDLPLMLSQELSDEWDLQGVLKAFGKELNLREKCTFATIGGSKTSKQSAAANSNRSYWNQQNQPQPTTSATLVVNNGQTKPSFNQVPNCLFCGLQHYSSSCTIVTDPNIRKKILQEKRKCFVCLKGGHISKNCHSWKMLSLQRKTPCGCVWIK